MFEKITVIDKVEILEAGALQVRRATYLLEDGIRLSKPLEYRRIAYTPGDNLTLEDPYIQEIAQLVWSRGSGGRI